MMKIPKIEWKPWNRNDIPNDFPHGIFLILLREDDYDDGATWKYSVDVAESWGDYIDGFWDTENDWDEGQKIDVMAYAELPYMLNESDLIEEK